MLSADIWHFCCIYYYILYFVMLPRTEQFVRNKTILYLLFHGQQKANRNSVLMKSAIIL